MTFYHFCAKRDAKSIKRNGLMLGQMYVPRDGDARSVEIFSGYQWITLDPARENQSWATRGIVKYDRTAVRFTVDIPDDSLDQILDREQIVKMFPGTESLFEGWPGSENWRVYHGWILPEWIKEDVWFDDNRANPEPEQLPGQLTMDI